MPNPAWHWKHTVWLLFEEKLSACLFPCQTPSALQRLVWAMDHHLAGFCSVHGSVTHSAGHKKKPTHVLELQLPKYLRVFQQFYMLLNYNKCKLLLCFRANEQRENPFTSATLEPIFTISWAVFKPHPALPRSSISILLRPSRQNKVLQASVPGFLKNYWLLTAQPQGHHLTSLTLSFHSAKLFLFCTNTLPALGFSYLNSFLAAHMHCIWLVLLLGFGKT